MKTFFRINHGEVRPRVVLYAERYPFRDGARECAPNGGHREKKEESFSPIIYSHSNYFPYGSYVLTKGYFLLLTSYSLLPTLILN